MAERGYINIDGLPDSVIPLPADAMVEVEIGGKKLSRSLRRAWRHSGHVMPLRIVMVERTK
jgi:hypothetical protein